MRASDFEEEQRPPSTPNAGSSHEQSSRVQSVSTQLVANVSNHKPYLLGRDPLTK